MEFDTRAILSGFVFGGHTNNIRRDVKRKERTWVERALREGGLWLCLGLGLLMFAALLSNVPEAASAGLPGANLVGSAGTWFANFAFDLAGQASYLFPAAIIGFSAWYLAPARAREDWSWPDAGVRAGGLVLVVVCGCGLLELSARADLGGGIVGTWLTDALNPVLDSMGSVVVLLALWMTGVTLVTSLSWVRLAEVTGRLTMRGFALLWRSLCAGIRALMSRFGSGDYRRPTTRRRAKITRPARKSPAAGQARRARQERESAEVELPSGVRLPSLSLLSDPPPDASTQSQDYLRAQAKRLEEKLQEFGVGVTVVAVSPGPVVTLFEVQPAAGIRASRITSLARDLSRSLMAHSVRVVESMPGKSTVGLEIANNERMLVTLGEILRSRTYANAQSMLTLGLGKDIAGDPVVADLLKMPHLLVAGATGSGKSVAINAMVLSLLYKSTPETVRLIMIDPKMLELSVYEGIPHLLCPVVTDVTQAANALRWCVAEMDRRYRLMSWVKTRSVEGYNNRLQVARDAGAPLCGPPENDEDEQGPVLEPLPRIVVVIDELADLMMVVGKKLEHLIARLTQKARAAGLHLIVATQRPSVDVITGLIKANIPARIAFRVSAQVDSRTILDQMGAETLLGKGDMLYLASGSSNLTRVHGAFVDDGEVLKVVAALKRTGGPSYDEQVTLGPVETDEADGAAADGGEVDELYSQAREIVTETGRASISYVQRRLRVGYNRAARLIEELERAGVVSEPDGRGERRVTIGGPE